eukprot:3280430-Pleurochrysis_carterae.AAC.1
MVVLGLCEAILQQLPGGLLVPMPFCSGVTVDRLPTWTTISRPSEPYLLYPAGVRAYTVWLVGQSACG